jgi:hypothetical protein
VGLALSHRDFRRWHRSQAACIFVESGEEIQLGVVVTAMKAARRAAAASYELHEGARIVKEQASPLLFVELAHLRAVSWAGVGVGEIRKLQQGS